jgi:hypothetical protein
MKRVTSRIAEAIQKSYLNRNSFFTKCEDIFHIEFLGLTYALMNTGLFRAQGLPGAANWSKSLYRLQ